jgi:hypothetical protein
MMGSISIAKNGIFVTFPPDEVITERLPYWPEPGEITFGSLLSRAAVRKITEKRPRFDPADIRSMKTGFFSGNFVVTLELEGDWHSKL